MEYRMTATAEKSSRVSYEEARQQAAQLRRTGSTYPEIAEHLAKIGYRSPKTRQPLKEMAVRLMVADHERAAAAEAAEREAAARDEQPMLVSIDERAAVERLREALRTLATLPMFSSDQRLTLIMAVLNEGRRVEGATRSSES